MASQRFKGFRGFQPLLRFGIFQGKPIPYVGLALLAAFLCTVISPALAREPVEVSSAPVVAQNLISTQATVQQGRELYEAGRFSDALKIWQQAESASKANGDDLHRAMVLSNLSLAYQQLGQWPQAIEAIETGLKLVGYPQVGGFTSSALKSSGYNSSDRLQVLAQALNTQGSLQLALGQPEQALDAWKQAIAAYTAISDREGIVRSQINQTQALKAMGLSRRALSSLQEVNQTLQAQPNSALKAAGLRSLGNALRSVGDFQQSQAVLQQSLAIAQTLQSPTDLSATLFSLGNTAQAQQDPAALEYYQQAATVAIAPLPKVEAQLNQLRLLLDQGNLATAQTLWPQIQAQLGNLPPSHAAIFAQINFAQSLIKAKDIQPASSINLTEVAQLLAAAVQQAQTLGDQRAESYALGTLGHVYETAQQWTDARTVTEKALLLAQAMNASDIAYQWQWQLGRLLQAQQQTLGTDKGNRVGAIAAYTQAVKTLQSLRNDLVAVNADVQFSFRDSIEPVYRELVALLLQTDGTTEPSQQNLIQARSVMESLQMAELENFFREACLQAQPIQIDQVDPKAAIIYPIILGDRLEVILSISGQPLRHYTSSVAQAELERTANQLRQSLSPIAASSDRQRLSQQVYDWLVRPAETFLRQSQTETIVFALDGVLRNVPVAALYDGTQFLVEKYNVALTPGLQLLNPRPLESKTLRVLTGGLTEARQGFSALPSVAFELEQITAEVPSKLLLNQDLTNANLEKQLGAVPFNVVHLATHGQFSSDASQTFILTWNDRINVKQLNALLQSRDQREATPLELLVLSACQTAAGDNRAALGLAGVAVRSGARSTVATLWSVNDEAASALMANFYQELTHPGTTKAQALRQAQLSLLKQPQFKQPYYWAPFVLVGNWL